MIKKAKINVYGIYYTRPQILKFENTSLISDEDMVSLFLGFVRLIKKSVELDMENKYSHKIKLLEKLKDIVRKYSN